MLVAATCAEAIDAYSVRFGVPPTRAFFIQVEVFLTNRTEDCFDGLAGEGIREDERQFLLIMVAFLAPKSGDNRHITGKYRASCHFFALNQSNYIVDHRSKNICSSQYLPADVKVRDPIE